MVGVILYVFLKASRERAGEIPEPADIVPDVAPAGAATVAVTTPHPSMNTNPQTTRDRAGELRSEARASLWRMAGPSWAALNVRQVSRGANM